MEPLQVANALAAINQMMADVENRYRRAIEYGFTPDELAIVIRHQTPEMAETTRLLTLIRSTFNEPQ